MEAVAEAAARLIAGVRQGRPAFLAIDCYRFYGHARKDKSPYRDAGEEETGRRKDPVAFARTLLLERGIATEAELAAIDTSVEAEMDASIDFTVAQKEPPLSTMFRDVYAPEEPEPEPVRTRIDRVLARN